MDRRGNRHGKITIAQNLAKRHGMRVYQYDKTDTENHVKLAASVPEIRHFNEASLDERWIHPELSAMFQYLLVTFSYRFPLV